MLKIFRALSVVALAGLVLAPAVFAQQPGQGQEGRGRRGQGFQRSPFTLPRQIELSEEQKTKLADIEKKFSEKWKAAQDKAQLTEEQRRARREASQKARQEGKQGEELRAAVNAAVSLTDDQKKGQEEATALRKEIGEAVQGILTDEQKARLKELREQRGRRGGGDRPQRNAA
jgi:hypothetical protein